MRRDAARNRQRLLAAARELFAERGLTTSLNDIAHHAGMGVGTVYRHFPDREQLIESLLEERIDQVETLLRTALEDPDPWQGVTGFLERSIELQAANRGLQQLLLGATGGLERIARARARLEPLESELVRRAHDARMLRADVGLQDLRILQLMLAPVIDLSANVAPELWRRYLALLLGALRATPEPAGPLPIAPPPLEQVDQMMVAAWRPHAPPR
jgi:AcrR family transcriptional regulator